MAGADARMEHAFAERVLHFFGVDVATCYGVPITTQSKWRNTRVPEYPSAVRRLSSVSIALACFSTSLDRSRIESNAIVGSRDTCSHTHLRKYAAPCIPSFATEANHGFGSRLEECAVLTHRSVSDSGLGARHS